MNRLVFPKFLKITILVIGALGALSACLVVGLAADSFYLKHEWAAARWVQREPYHYEYDIQIVSSFWRSDFRIEIQNNKILRTIDLSTGMPAEIWNMIPGSYMHQTNLIWQYMEIDQIFKLIEANRRPPKTFNAFLTRTNPSLYYALAERGLLPYERTSCDPAFPKVRYNPEYGYPETLVLGGNPCTTVLELATPVSLQIDGFRVLP